MYEELIVPLSATGIHTIWNDKKVVGCAVSLFVGHLVMDEMKEFSALSA